MAIVALIDGASLAESEDGFNGFEVDPHEVPLSDIVRGTSKDGIPAVFAPEFVAPEDATRWVTDSTLVIGVSLEGKARAYPRHLIEYHQVVNDVIAGVPIVVTYDPIAGTPMAYRSTVDGRRLTFGVSGLLYNANFLLYDRETGSLWSQLMGKAVAGHLAGRSLDRLRVRWEPFGAWHTNNSNPLVLVRPMPKKIDYRYSPYSSYWTSETVPFPVLARDDRYHPKEVVLGVEYKGVRRAYIGSILTAAGGRIVDEIDGQKLRIEYDSSSSAFNWIIPEEVEVTDAYWFSWKAFHPDTEIWTSGSAEPSL